MTIRIEKSGFVWTIIHSRPEAFEPPTTWFEATYSFDEFTAEPCGFLKIKFLGNSEIQRDKPQ